MLEKILLFPINMILISMIWLYKFILSPVYGINCCYLPTCSSYAVSALWSFGLITGGYLSIKRILRCNSRSHGGIDHPPLNIKGDYKWIC